MLFSIASFSVALKFFFSDAPHSIHQKNPVAFRYLEGVTDFQGFLIKNFAIYEQDPEKYEETFIRMAESQARVDAPILEFTADELMKGTR